MFLLQASQQLPLPQVASLSPLLILTIAIIELVIGIVLIVCAVKLRSTDSKTLKNWSIVSIVFAILSNIGGLINLGFVLALIGGIFGLWVSKKSLKSRPLMPFLLVLASGIVVIFVSVVTMLLLFGIL